MNSRDEVAAMTLTYYGAAVQNEPR